MCKHSLWYVVVSRDVSCPRPLLCLGVPLFSANQTTTSSFMPNPTGHRLQQPTSRGGQVCHRVRCRTNVAAPEQGCARSSHATVRRKRTGHGMATMTATGTHRNAESGTSTPDLTQSMAQTSHFGGDQLPWCRLDLKRMDTHITRCSVSQNLCSHTACIAGAERESGHKRTPASRFKLHST